MKKYKKIILIIEVVILLVLIFSLIYLKYDNNDLYKTAFEEEPEIQQENIEYNKLSIATDNSIIPTIEKCINKYMMYSVEENQKAIFNILDEEYKNKKHINNSTDIKEENYNGNEQVIKIREIYKESKNMDIDKFYIRLSTKDIMKTNYIEMGNDRVEELPYYDSAIEDAKNNKEKDLYIIVKLNYSTNVYTIEPMNLEQFQNIEKEVEK